MTKPSEEMLALARPFILKDGVERVFAATCCNRILVTVEKPEKCRCGKPVESIEITADDLR